MILLFILCFTNIIFVQSKTYEISHRNSNEFLKSKNSFRMKYEESRETTEAKRESCLNEYQQKKIRHLLSPFCLQYCIKTMDCQSNAEQSACLNPLWPSQTIKYVQKFKRMCYIRITEILQYEQAEQMCHNYGLELAIIDNIRLFERLKQLNMFNTTCKGQCPKAKGYYIGLKRLLNNQTESKWIWSNNVTWTQNEIDCDNDSHILYPNANLLCYIGNDGQKKTTIWNKGEPNNHRNSIYQTDEQCVEIIANTNKEFSYEQAGKLNDIPCTKPALGVICQMKGIHFGILRRWMSPIFVDIKPMNLTRFESFATIIGYNKTEFIENDLFLNFNRSIPVNLDAITEALGDLLILPSFTIEQATNVFNIVDQLIDIIGQIDIKNDSLKLVTNKLLHFLDLFSIKIQIENRKNILFEYKNMNLSIVDIDLNNENNEWFTIKNKKDSNGIIEINIRILQRQFIDFNIYRFIEIIFSNFNLFPQINITQSGIPISYHIANITNIKINEDFLRFQIRISKSFQSRNISCVYWSFNENNGSWIADNSCHFVGYVNNYAQCYCNHLKHFALFESEEIHQSLSIIENFLLSFVIYIGVCLSIFGLIMTLMTYVVFCRSQRNHLRGSLIMLCLSLLCVNCLYIPFNLIQSKFSNISCILLAFFFHYFLITLFMWMLIIGIIQYLNFVQIFNTHISNFFTKICFIGWIIPFIFPFIVVLFGSNGGYIGEFHCWINNQILHYLTFILPLSIIILLNLILFGFILKSIFHRNTIVVNYQRYHSKIQMSITICCFISIGCTWLFGFIVFFKSNFFYQLIFCICNSFQGFLIFIFHVYLSKPKRELWRIFFLRYRSQKHAQISSNQTNLMTISNSNGENKHPIIFSFNTRSLNNEQSKNSYA